MKIIWNKHSSATDRPTATPPNRFSGNFIHQFHTWFVDVQIWLTHLHLQVSLNVLEVVYISNCTKTRHKRYCMHTYPLTHTENMSTTSTLHTDLICQAASCQGRNSIHPSCKIRTEEVVLVLQLHLVCRDWWTTNHQLILPLTHWPSIPAILTWQICVICWGITTCTSVYFAKLLPQIPHQRFYFGPLRSSAAFLPATLPYSSGLYLASVNFETATKQNSDMDKNVQH